MGDEQHDLVRSPLPEVGQHLMLRFGVERGGGLIEDEDGRVADHRPGDGQALALPRGELAAAFAQFGVEASLHLPDELVGKGDPRSLLDLIPGCARRIADVIGHLAGEQHVLLQGDGAVRPQVVDAHVAKVYVVDEHRAAVGVVEAQKQRHQGRLARSRGTDDGRYLARFGSQLDIGQHALVRLVGEVDVLPSHACDGVRVGHRRGMLDDLGFEIEEVERPFEADEEILDHAPDPDHAVAGSQGCAEPFAGGLERTEVPQREPEEGRRPCA